MLENINSEKYPFNRRIFPAVNGIWIEATYFSYFSSSCVIETKKPSILRCKCYYTELEMNLIQYVSVCLDRETKRVSGKRLKSDLFHIINPRSTPIGYSEKKGNGFGDFIFF